MFSTQKRQILPPPPYLLPAPHIIFLFYSCPSWNYINILILIKLISFPTGWPSHPVYIFWKWEPDAPPSGSQFQKIVNRMAWSSGCLFWQPDDQAIRFTVFWNCEPDGGCIRFSFLKKYKPEDLIRFSTQQIEKSSVRYSKSFN